MLIRSQDKKDLVALDDLGIIPSRNSTGMFDVEVYKHDAHCVIGSYSTEAKAIRVLDMIQDFYNKCFAFSMGNDGYYNNVSENKVFEMPSDEEVEG